MCFVLQFHAAALLLLHAPTHLSLHAQQETCAMFILSVSMCGDLNKGQRMSKVFLQHALLMNERGVVGNRVRLAHPFLYLPDNNTGLHWSAVDATTS